GYEAVVAGVVHGRIQNPVQAHSLGFGVVFVFVAAALRNLDDHVHDQIFVVVQQACRICIGAFVQWLEYLQCRGSRRRGDSLPGKESPCRGRNGSLWANRAGEMPDPPWRDVMSAQVFDLSVAETKMLD